MKETEGERERREKTVVINAIRFKKTKKVIVFIY